MIGKLEPWDILYRSTCKPKKKLDSDFLKGNFDNGTPEKVCWNVHFLEMFRQDEKHIMLKNHILCFSILSTKSKSEIRCNKRVGGWIGQYLPIWRLSKLWLNRFLAFFRVDFGRCWNKIYAWTYMVNVYFLNFVGIQFANHSRHGTQQGLTNHPPIRLMDEILHVPLHVVKIPLIVIKNFDHCSWCRFFFYINCQCMNHTFQTMTTTGNSLPKPSCHGTCWWHYSFRSAGESCRWDRRPAEHGVKRPLGVTVSTETYQHVISTNIIKS